MRAKFWLEELNGRDHSGGTAVFWEDDIKMCLENVRLKGC